MRTHLPFVRHWFLPLFVLLSGCHAVVLHPAGDVAFQQRNLIFVALGLMLTIVGPVIVLTLAFAWRYRAKSTQKLAYDPHWHHSTHLELMIWAAPLLIIIALGAVTWVSTHQLDPYRSLSRISAHRPMDKASKPLVVEVVALDWKWLFFYPEQGIASVNELVAPVDRPLTFKITATNVMNSFFIPSLAGQIYAMPGMETQLHAVVNEKGVYEGFSSNFSGDGFSGMRFKFYAVSEENFASWVHRVQNLTPKLDHRAYEQLARPSEKEPPHVYASYAPGPYESLLMPAPVSAIFSDATSKKNVKPMRWQQP
jgi:cytochrome o ubiquinol oxidase subunit 2